MQTTWGMLKSSADYLPVKGIAVILRLPERLQGKPGGASFSTNQSSTMAIN
jgi:hypothetical protein